MRFPLMVMPSYNMQSLVCVQDVKEHIRSCVRSLVLISYGEHPEDDQLGTLLLKMQHRQPNEAFEKKLMMSIQAVLKTYEKRINDIHLSLVRGGESDAKDFSITIFYNVIKTGEKDFVIIRCHQENIYEYL